MNKKIRKIAAMLALTAMLAASVPAAYAGETGSAAGTADTAGTANGAGAANTSGTEEKADTSKGILDTLGDMFGSVFSLSGSSVQYENATTIRLSDSGITVNGSAVSTDESAAVYTANDIIYYEDRETYDDGYTYGEGTADDKHTAEEAAAQTVVHITEPGTYILSGKLSAGQIFVDLGDDAKTDPNAVVTLVLDDVDINCDVAPAVLFYSVYECDTAWVAYDEGETTEYNASTEQDTSKAGANVIIADGTENTVTGSHVAKIYKDNADEKKKYKFDAAFYSKMSMNIDGETKGDGVLTITADNEGLDTEMHLTINSGNVNINSQDDGINTNEDNVSVTTINGGSLHIVAGLGDEGDGIDSNGYLVINDGVVIATARPAADAGLDSDLGSYINGGYVVATGSTMDWPESDSEQVTMNLQFASMQNSDEAIIITDTEGNVVFAYDPDKDEASGTNNRGYQGAVISSPELEVGETYHVYVGGSVSGTEVNGLYEADTVTGYTDAIQQEYTGTDVGGMGGPGMGGQGGMTPPDGSQDGTTRPERGQRPDFQNGNTDSTDGTNTGNTNTNGQPPALPDGTQPQEGATPPEGMTPPDGTQDGTMTSPEGGQMMPGSQNGTASGTASTEFCMTDKVNAFSGVTDAGTSSGTGTVDSGNQTGGQPSDNTGKDEGGQTTDTQSLPFTDVKDSDWFYGNVKYAYTNGLFKGTSDTTFSPQTQMSRAMLWCVIARMEDADSSDGDTWYSAAQAWCKAQGISDGTQADNNVTREQIVTMLWRLAGSPSSSQDLSAYTDSSSVSAWAEDAMAWAVEKGIVKGDNNKKLNPKNNATRAEVAALAERYETGQADSSTKAA